MGRTDVPGRSATIAVVATARVAIATAIVAAMVVDWLDRGDRLSLDDRHREGREPAGQAGISEKEQARDDFWISRADV